MAGRKRPLSGLEKREAAPAQPADALARARSAIESGDRVSALQLLRELAERQLDPRPLAGAVGDALIATASARPPRSTERQAMACLEQVQRARDTILQLLAQTPFSPADLAAIGSAVDACESAMRSVNGARVRPDVPDAEFNQDDVRVGSVWLELKYIPDPHTGRQYGPYLYGRWREGTRKRSRYIGKLA